jgi:NTE family protein
MIKNLALKGGGVKGVAYVGAIKELDKANLYNTIERVSGTSAGALMAGMICAGYSVAAIEELMVSIIFNKFKKGWNPFRILTHFGLYTGDYIINFVEDFLKHSPKNLTAEATFMDMKNAGCKDLYVFACNTGMHTIHEFSADRTPDCKVAEAVRASMSIPFFFKGWTFKNDTAVRKHIYIDGGVVYNYPLSFFDDDRFTPVDVNPESIGLYLYSTQKPKDIAFRFGRPLFFSRHLFESILDAQDYLVFRDREQMDRSIMIDDLGLAATDFNITTDQKNALIASGSNAARAFIAKMAAAGKHQVQTTLN